MICECKGNIIILFIILYLTRIIKFIYFSLLLIFHNIYRYYNIYRKRYLQDDLYDVIKNIVNIYNINSQLPSTSPKDRQPNRSWGLNTSDASDACHLFQVIEFIVLYYVFPNVVSTLIRIYSIDHQFSCSIASPIVQILCAMTTTLVLWRIVFI